MQVTKDPFSTKKKTIAITNGGQGAMGIRCFPDGGLSVVIMLNSERSYAKDDVIPFKYRADENEIVSDKAEPFGEKGIEMPNAAQILADAQHAKAINIRVTTPDDLTLDLSFNPKGGVKALHQIVSDCPADSPESKDDAGSTPKK